MKAVQQQDTSIGSAHNFALSQVDQTIQREGVPPDVEDYIKIVKNQARVICGGEAVCLDSIDDFVVEAVNYILQQHNTIASVSARLQDSGLIEEEEAENRERRERRQLKDFLPENNLDDTVLDAL